MQAGSMRDSLTIQVRSGGNDASGEPILTWTDFATGINAMINDVSGREYISAQSTLNAVTTVIVIRWRLGVTAAMRINAKGVIYNIESVLEPDNKRREMLLMCVRNVANG